MSSQFILVPEDQTIINIDFITKVIINLTTFKVIIYHGITPSAITGATQAYTFSDAPTTQAFYDRIMAMLQTMVTIKTI